MKKVLIVEDDMDIREFLEKKLIAEGLSVRVAVDGESGIEILKGEDFDLLVLDITMPGIDGIVFYHEMRGTLKKNIPTVILTNMKNASYQEDIKEYIVKSDVSLDELVQKLKSHVGL